MRTARRYSHDHSITSEVLSLVCPSLRVWKFKFMFVELMFFRFGLLYWLGSAAFGYFLVSYLNQYVTAATHFSFFWTIWWVNRLLYPSTRVIYYLYCSYRQRPLTVQLKMEYSIIPLVHLSLELQPLLQLASSDVNLTCGVINKFSIRSFNSWVPLGLGLWLKWGRPAGTRMIIQSLQRCFH